MEKYLIQAPSRVEDNVIFFYKEHDRGSVTFCKTKESAKKFDNREDAEKAFQEISNKSKNHEIVKYTEKQ